MPVNRRLRPYDFQSVAYDHGGLTALKSKPSGVHDLKAAYETAIGHATSHSTIYNVLARHGWRKLMPRPFHPKRDIAAQNALGSTTWLSIPSFCNTR